MKLNDETKAKFGKHTLWVKTKYKIIWTNLTRLFTFSNKCEFYNYMDTIFFTKGIQEKV